MKLNIRKRLFVDSAVQLMLVQRVLIHWSVFFALFGLTLFTVEYFLREPGTTFMDCLQSVVSRNLLMLILIGSVLPVFIYDTLKMSHRFAGPISRLKKNLKSLADGESVEAMSFRNGDYWSELSHNFNSVAARLNQLSQNSTSKTSGV